ncbi:FecR family protein [Cyclobacterium sp. SYSU L10401]|uniref:FecR family protein n=1 Tax=Cyclobacterium sp. SYSU L10401 TaxID=2678657 RepID=UPI0013D0FDB4|nr:FecR domain-containing protein [Cyclobacterium sp. SYSU L10401]
MSKHQFLALLEKQIRGLTSESEDRLIDAIFERMEGRGMHWKLDASAEEVRESIKAKIDLELKPQKDYSSVSGILRIMTVSLVGILMIAFILVPATDAEFFAQMDERVTNDKQKATITLKDGSKVHLNVSSKLSFPDQFGSDERKVSLEGEAFFEIAHDASRPFVVEVNEVETKVLGTAFNVNAYRDHKVEIAVASGSVGVRENQNIREGMEQYLVLRPRQMAVVDKINHNVSVESIDIDHYLAWRSESISFDLLPFDRVVERLEEVYSMEIELEGYKEGDCLVRANYINRSLYHVLYSLKNVVEFEYESGEGRNMTLYYKGCKF